jgi:hypothetical protein
MLIFLAATFAGRTGTALVPMHHYMMIGRLGAVPQRQQTGRPADIPQQGGHGVARSARFHSRDNGLKGDPASVRDPLQRIIGNSARSALLRMLELKGPSQEYEFSAVF